MIRRTVEVLSPKTLLSIVELISLWRQQEPGVNIFMLTIRW